MTTPEESPSTGLYDFLGWLEVNKQKLLIAFGAAVVVGFALYAYRWQAERRELNANGVLLALRSPAASDTNAVPPSAAQFLEVAAKFPNTGAAGRAVLLAAGAYFSEGKYAEAQAKFDDFLRANADSPFAATAAYGAAASIEAQGKTTEAIAAYQNLITRYPRSAQVDECKLSLARIFESQNKPAEALKLYDELTAPTAASTSRTEALSRKNALLSAHPELAPPPLPAGTTNPPSATNAPAAVPGS